MYATPHFPTSQVDRLGRTLKTGSITEANIRLLFAYRRSFENSYQLAMSTIHNNPSLEPTGRPAKSTASIIDKLRRETIRLSQIQDIAGCRIVVADLRSQESALASLSQLFPGARIVDRRQASSYGYRAVHLIPRIDDYPIEIQLRTALQHLWAELSEKFADLTVPEVKYGGGPDEVRSLLAQLTEGIVGLEALEAQLGALEAQLEALKSHQEDLEAQLEALQARQEALQAWLTSTRSQLVSEVLEALKA
jgi:putative GTP pyrophosphokinase